MIDDNEIVIDISSSGSLTANISGECSINTYVNSYDEISSLLDSNNEFNTNIEGYGPPGPKGKDGITYIPEIESVNSIDYDQKASATVRTQANKMLFNFNIPKGKPGEMSKDVYDKDDDGIVDNAKSIDGLSRNKIEEQFSSLSRALREFEMFVEEKIDNINPIPVGVINPFAGNDIPFGWLLCDGREVSRFMYSDLFEVIGTIYGSGDGSTTFNLPDLRKKIPIGYSYDDDNYNVLGKNIGNESHSLSINELAKHKHSTAVSNSGSHAHNTWNCFTQKVASGGISITMTGEPADGRGNLTDYQGDHSHTVTINETGNGEPFSLIQPGVLINYIIKY